MTDRALFVQMCDTNAIALDERNNMFTILTVVLGEYKEHLPLLHSIAASPMVPGGQRHTKTTCSLIHSAPLPQPSVRQSKIARLEAPNWLLLLFIL